MIYIFSGCQSVCSLPGYACSACGEACKSCPGMCKGCSDVCKGCGGRFKQFMERPLSAYLFLTTLISVGTVFQVLKDMKDPKGCVSYYLYLLLGFAAINVIFAVYVQCQVWKEIMTHSEEFIDGDKPHETYAGPMAAAAFAGLRKAAEDRVGGGSGEAVEKAAQPAANPGKILVPTKVVQESFKKVFLEDFGVLIMFVALLGVFGISFVPEKLGPAKNSCNVEDMTKYCGYAFFWTSFLFCFAYYRCACCANKVTIAKPESDEVQE